MAHDIFQDRRMFYSGETPWHGLGEKLPANAQWADVAPMFPRVDERPLIMPGGIVAPDVKALVSSDDGRYLSTVGADYFVVQAESVAGAILQAASENGAIFHTGGLLGERGARGWLLGELPEAAFTVEGDNSPIRAYFLGLWGHDGRTPVRLKNVSTRTVCANTVAIALGEKGSAFDVSVRHTSGAEVKVEDAGRSFAKLISSGRKLEEFANASAQVRMTRDDVMSALDLLMPKDEEASPLQVERRDAAQGKIVTLLGSPTVAPAIRGTAWGLMQAMSEFSEHFTARMTDAQRQIDSIAARSIDQAGTLAAYQAVASVAGLSLPR
jgi:phage/plasmid-like protein (TIGR03299 family)